MLNAKLSFVCLCFALASTASTSHAQCTPYPSAVQWRIEDGGNGHYYARIDDGVLWPAANAAAEALGGHLATITSQLENDHIAAIATDGNVNVKHLGGIRDGDTWRWITGEPWSYTNWYPGEPNNLNGKEIYLATWVIPGTWNDIYPAYAAGYIVEWETEQLDCDANGICDASEMLADPGLDMNGDGVLDRCDCRPPKIAVEWKIADGGNGHYYARIDDGVLWPEAKAAAEALGGHLATITSQPENAHIAVIATDGNFNVKHLGGLRDGASWRWITGEPWSYTNWYPGEPNNATGNEIYLSTWITPGTWNDIYPAYAAGYIIEWEPLMADCDGNGICDFVQIAQQPNLDVNGDATLDQCQCIADVVADGVVDAVDLARVLNDWGSPNSSGDIDRNGIVDASDLAYVLSTWGPCHP